jgi:CO/xanthine dehydrogenase FAD-binding subunit
VTIPATTAVLHRPRTVGEAVRMLADAVDADLLAGGTDLVPALRSGDRRPRAIVALRRVLELRALGAGPDALTIGAGVTYTELADWPLAPGLAATARVVGSAQIRNVGTVGGALGTANPRGDLLTFLAAADAEVLLRSTTGPRTVRLPAFLSAGCRRGELVTAVRLPRPSGPQVYLKIGGRQAAYPALVSCALLVDRVRNTVSCAIGGIASQPLRAPAAETFAAAEIDWVAVARSEPGRVAVARSEPGRVAADAAETRIARRFGELVAEAARLAEPALPDGPRTPAGYRWHAAGVLAGRALARALPGADR